MQAFVGINAENDSIVVSFRGSDNVPNWIENFKFFKVSEYPKCHGCEVHDGFYQIWLSIMDPVINEVKRLVEKFPHALVFVTGHSLGAAIAALCATELGASSQSLGYPIEGVYTYGQPRVGNRAFSIFYNSGTRVSWRNTHWRDPVPHLPPLWIDDNYHHTATEVFWTENSDRYTICDGSGEDGECSDQFDYTVDVDAHLHYLNVTIDDC